MKKTHWTKETPRPRSLSENPSLKPESEQFGRLAKRPKQAMLVLSSIQADAARRSKGRSKLDWILRQAPRLFHCMLAVSACLLTGCPESLGGNPEQGSSHASPLAAQAYQVLEQGLSDPDPRVRTSAIEAVVQTLQSRLMPQVKRLIHDPIVPVRFAALVAIGDMRYSLGRSDVQQIFNEVKENPSVRLGAAYALDRLGLGQFASHYYDAITSTDMTTRANSALLLGKSGNSNTLRLLYWALEDRDSDDRVLLQAIESIAKLGDERIYQKLWTKLISAYADDRIYGIRAMGELGNEPAKQALHTMLEDPVLEVRLAAAEQLGRLNDPVGQNLVQDAFKPAPERTEADQVRIKVMAALAIGEIGTESLARQLPSLLNDRSAFVRISAAKAVFRQKMK